jgi:aldose 1-epimerase
MTNRYQRGQVIRYTAEGPSSFAAEIGKDETLNASVISLLYEDQNNAAHNINVGIVPELGSNMFRFRVGEHDIIYCEQELLKQCNFTGNFVLWPLPNRVRDKRYTYKGKTYSLEAVKRPAGNEVLIHGLVFDRIWQYDEPVVGVDNVSVTTFIDFNAESPFYESYPFESRLSLTFTLTETGVATTYRVENKGKQTLPFGFALHPYFALLSGKENTYISVAANTVMEADTELLPTGRMLDVRSMMYAMYDLHQPVPVGTLRLDHIYTDLEERGKTIIDYRKQAMQVHISATDDFTHIIIYTPEGVQFCCLEHQTCSTDAINLNNQGEELQKAAHLLEVQPGESKSGTIDYSLKFV